MFVTTEWGNQLISEKSVLLHLSKKIQKYLVVSEIMCTFANVNYSKTIVSHNYETISTDSCNDGNGAFRYG